jgi:selenocysteine-specific translation elongation factor
VCTYIEGGKGGLNSLERHYLQTIRYALVRLNDKAVGLIDSLKHKRNIDLMRAVLKVISYSL